MALIPYFRWEQLKDDDAKREFLLENLPQQVLKTGHMKGQLLRCVDQRCSLLP